MTTQCYHGCASPGGVAHDGAMRIPLLAGLGITLTLGLAAPATAAPLAPAVEPVVVNVPVDLVQAPDTHALYGMTTIRIGDSAPIRVTVDTGSVGLRLLPGAWKTVPKGVVMSQRKITWAVDGQRLSGKVGSGRFSISGLVGSYPVDFMFMNESSWAKSAAAEGIQGVLGIGMSRQNLMNPLTSLTGNVGRQWTLHFSPNEARTGGKGTLALGALVPPTSFTTFHPSSQGFNGEDVPLWNDQAAQGCWKIGSLSQICGGTYFDSMAPFMLIKGTSFAKVPVDSNGFVKTGTPISMGGPRTSFYAWNFDAGTRFGLNRAKVSASGKTLVNTSSALYSAFTVAYDVVRGIVTLS